MYTYVYMYIKTDVYAIQHGRIKQYFYWMVTFVSDKSL